MLNWRSVTNSNDCKFMVKGTELAVAIVPGTFSRFQVCEVRSYDKDNHADGRYLVRDAHTVSDAEVKAGVRPRIVANVATLDEALKFCQQSTTPEISP